MKSLSATVRDRRGAGAAGGHGRSLDALARRPHHRRVRAVPRLARSPRRLADGARADRARSRTRSRRSSPTPAARSCAAAGRRPRAAADVAGDAARPHPAPGRRGRRSPVARPLPAVAAPLPVRPGRVQGRLGARRPDPVDEPEAAAARAPSTSAAPSRRSPSPRRPSPAAATTTDRSSSWPSSRSSTTTRAPDGQAHRLGLLPRAIRLDRDMTDAIEAQVERFAPGFRDRVLARHVMSSGAAGVVRRQLRRRRHQRRRVRPAPVPRPSRACRCTRGARPSTGCTCARRRRHRAVGCTACAVRRRRGSLCDTRCNEARRPRGSDRGSTCRGHPRRARLREVLGSKDRARRGRRDRDVPAPLPRLARGRARPRLGPGRAVPPRRVRRARRGAPRLVRPLHAGASGRADRHRARAPDRRHRGSGHRGDGGQRGAGVGAGRPPVRRRGRERAPRLQRSAGGPRPRTTRTSSSTSTSGPAPNRSGRAGSRRSTTCPAAPSRCRCARSCAPRRSSAW